MGQIWLVFSSYSIRMVHFLAYTPPSPSCWKDTFPLWQGSVLLTASCGAEPWLSVGSWLSGLDIPIPDDLRKNMQPLPPNISRQFQARPEGRNTEVGCSRHYIPLHRCQIPESVHGLMSNFQSSQKGAYRVAEWLNGALGSGELLFSRTIMLVL